MIRLNDTATIFTGYCQRGGSFVDSRNVQIVQARDFDSEFINLQSTHISSKYASFLKDGDILVKARGSKFEAKVFSGASILTAAANTLLVVRLKNKYFIPGYIAQIINQPETQKRLRLQSTGAVLSSLSPMTLGSLEIKQIPLEKQQKICDALNTMNEYISLHKRYLRLEEKLAQEIISNLMKGTK
jgi:restriction endonuclease S subunit